MQLREFYLAVAQWFWLGDTECPDSGPQGEHPAGLGRHLAHQRSAKFFYNATVRSCVTLRA